MNWNTILDILWLCVAVGLLVFGFKKLYTPPAKGWFDRWAELTDNDQEMILAVLLVIVCLPLAVGLVMLIVLTKTYDAVVIGLVTSTVSGLLVLGSIGMKHVFEGGRSAKQANDAMAKIAGEAAAAESGS